MIRVKCPECGAPLQFSPVSAGARRRCSRCGFVARVPEEVGTDLLDKVVAVAASADREMFVLIRRPYRAPKVRVRTKRIRRLLQAMRILACVVAGSFVAHGVRRWIAGDWATWAPLSLLALLCFCRDAITRRSGVGSRFAIFMLLTIGTFIAWEAWLKPPRRGSYTRPLDEEEEVRTVQFLTTRPGAWDGFRDLKWGAHADDIAGLRILYKGGDRVDYTRPGERVVIGEGEISVTYTFYRGALGQVTLSCHAPSNIERFKEAISARYGCNDADITPGKGAEFWTLKGHSSDGNEVTLDALFSPTIARVSLGYVPLQDEYERDPQRAANDTRPTTREQR